MTAPATTVTIDGYTVTTVKLDSLAAVELLADLVATLGPALGPLAELLATATEPGPDDAPPTIQDLGSMDVAQLVPVLTAAGKGLADGGVGRLAAKLLRQSVLVGNGVKIDGSKPGDLAKIGNPLTLLRAMWHAATYNLSDFFGAGGLAGLFPGASTPSR